MKISLMQPAAAPVRVRSIAIAAVLSGALLLGGCGGDGDSEIAVEVAEPSEAASTTVDGRPTGAVEADDGGSGGNGSGADDTVAEVGNGEGISADEAEQTEVLAGDYDMLLTGPERVDEADGCLRFEVTALNVGGETDTYRIRSDAATIDTGGQDPGAVTVDPGDEAAITVELCDAETRSMSVQVFSDGLDGQLVDQLDFG